MYSLLHWWFMELFIFICTGKNNNLLTGGIVDVNSRINTTIICTFLCEFNGSTHCRVRYGTDPTYTYLPYVAESIGIGNMVRVILRERLNSSTQYFFTVSAVIGNVTVVEQGTFKTPQYSDSKYALYLMHFNHHPMCINRSPVLTVLKLLFCASYSNADMLLCGNRCTVVQIRTHTLLEH